MDGNNWLIHLANLINLHRIFPAYAYFAVGVLLMTLWPLLDNFDAWIFSLIKIVFQKKMSSCANEDNFKCWLSVFRRLLHFWRWPTGFSSVFTVIMYRNRNTGHVLGKSVQHINQKSIWYACGCFSVFMYCTIVMNGLGNNIVSVLFVVSWQHAMFTISSFAQNGSSFKYC